MDSRNSHSLFDTLLLGSFLKAPIDLPLSWKLIKDSLFLSCESSKGKNARGVFRNAEKFCGTLSLHLLLIHGWIYCLKGIQDGGAVPALHLAPVT